MGKPIRVLIIEDSANDAELLLEELQLGGYDATHERVDTAQAMTTALGKRAWDIILCDYNMPQFNAPAALKLLQESGLDLPFILVSGAIGEDAAVEAMKSGAHDYIMKGKLKRLMPAIERELREAEIRRNRRLAEQALEENERALSTLMSNLSGMVYRCQNDRDWTMEFVSEGCYGLTGYRPSDLTEGRVSYGQDIIHPEDQKAVWDNVQFPLRERLPFKLNYRIIGADRKEKWVWEQGCGVFSPKGDLLALEGFITDITERKLAEETIRRMAYYDTLTGLPNRATIHEHLLDIIHADTGAGQPFALLLLGLDRFKEINDTLGHNRGDVILKQVGRRLREAMFERDIVARPGGDEFAVLLVKLANSKDIDVAIEKLVKALDKPFFIENIPVRVEVSIGIAIYPDHGTEANALFQRANIAMHISKQAGIPYAMYDSAQDRHSPKRLALMGELHHAIEHGELLLFYQPKISLKTQRITGAEALVRWKHPLRGMIPPNEFILPAEQTGLIHPLTQWVLAEGMHQCKALRRAGTGLTVSVNLSARNLLDPNLLDLVAKWFPEIGVAPESMKFEITESVIMADPVNALNLLMRFREMGVRFSIDDFGTGYSSLSYLKRLPVEEIKIDKSFVINMAENPNDAVIVRSTIDLAHNLGLAVIAEGVENQDIWDRLSALGCDEAQGYYMARPMPAEDLERWLSESPWGLKK